ncbi:CoA transferase [Alphaproteobacteria bacterium]|nr:CoA transferase [Rhodobiaceae bacterium]MDA8524516.1 CoA transferase [Alphaproteobacteria bacterium]MDA8622594.1 CoA transferase [bacterium]RPF94346.1 MAG: CoA transferase [Rhizobiales bacterium TMED162]MDA8544669.1 CoA transferase [Alphaproteobacteria bacterium]
MLEGIKIIEMATYIAAPSAGGIMADWGADVIKIEPLGGCPMRKFYASAMTDDYPDNPVSALDNRGKRAIAVNTGTQEGREIVRKLIEDADVFLTNVRPGQLTEQGLDFDTLSKINPKLVYASVTGFGLQGEEADKPGFDTAAFNAKSGFGWMMTPKGSAPAPLRTAAGDHITGIATASGILAALLKAQRTGEGELVESSLVRSAAYAVGCDYGTWLRYGRIARSRPREEAIVAINNYYVTKDDCWLFINGRPGEPDWPDVARAIGREDLIEDERFGSLRDRRRNGVELIALMDEAFAQKTLDEWKPILDEAGLIWSPVQTFEQAFEDPQMHDAGVFVDMPKADGTSYKNIASPIRFGNESTDPKGPLPEIGQHTMDILAQNGFDEETCETYLKAGIIGQHEG